MLTIIPAIVGIHSVIYFDRYAIDAMHSVCLKEAGSYAVGLLAEETTLIRLTFGGYLLSKVVFLEKLFLNFSFFNYRFIFISLHLRMNGIY